MLIDLRTLLARRAAGTAAEARAFRRARKTHGFFAAYRLGAYMCGG